MKKSKSANSKKYVIVSAIFIAILAAISLFIFLLPRDYSIAFYRIEDQQRQGIISVIDSLGIKQKITYITYDSDKSLKEQIPLTKKPDMIITISGFALDSAIDRASGNASLSDSLSTGMTSSIRSAIRSQNGKITALPFLSSHMEADIDLREFQNSETKQINSWRDVEKFMKEQKKRKDSPMIFAGGTPEFMLDFMGAFAESLDGIDSYNQAVKILTDNSEKFNPLRVAIRLCDEPDSPFATSIKHLKGWYKQGFMHPGTFSMTKNDVEGFASSALSSVLFMSLENHRSMSQNAISRYTSIYFPSERSANSRIFTGKTYFAIPLKKSNTSAIIAEGLVNNDIQEKLSRTTGLAPVLAQCRTPDKQSNDARYWIAATSAPLPGISNEVYLTKEQKTALAAELAARIRE